MKEQRYSKQRELVVEALKGTNSHPDAYAVYDAVVKDLPNISLGTIYRNLKQLEESGLIRKIVIDNGVEHYDYDVCPHHHFICKKCGKVYDVETDGETKLLQEQFTVEKVEVLFYGICKDCNKIIQ
ncbi:MAG: transcriptional repressor [Clostridia bacterium]